jgi:hypothetical protein
MLVQSTGFTRGKEAAVTHAKIDRSRRRALKQIGAGTLSAMASAVVSLSSDTLAQNAVSSSMAQPPLLYQSGLLGKDRSLAAV